MNVLGLKAVTFNRVGIQMNTMLFIALSDQFFKYKQQNIERLQ